MTNQEAIEVLKLNNPFMAGKDKETFSKAIDRAIEVLEKQKTGHWIELGCVGNDNYDFECSECRHTDTHSKTVKVNYCWYCGAKMEGENK